MERPNPRLGLVVGTLAEYLGVSAGKTNELPVGILTFRSHTKRPLNLMVSRAHLARLREDIDFLLAHSDFLKGGPSPEVSLAKVEGIHDRLG